MRRLLSDPLIPFAILGGLIAAAYLWLQPETEAVETITIRPESIAALVQNEELLTGRPVDEEAKKRLRESYIDDEVLLREARRQGLDKTDSRVRKRLLGVMRFSATSVVPEPSRAQLEVYYKENLDQYRSPPSVTFDHVYFGFDSEAVPADPAEFIAELGASDDPISLGETAFPSNHVKRASRRDLVGSFGAEFASAVEGLEPGAAWHGPFDSNRGTHYLRIAERHPAEVAPFENMENYLRQDWMFQKTREDQQGKIDEMRKRYRIEILETEPAA